MFTGIVEEIGSVKSLRQRGSILRLEISASKIIKDTQLGQSVCVNGVCLTVSEKQQDLLCFELIQETAQRTNLPLLANSDQVNLERALKVNARIDGHFVSGHIDGLATIKNKRRIAQDMVMELETNSDDILSYIVSKGSVAVDGVSLTVSSLQRHAFSVSLIPFTLKQTTLGMKQPADLVNIECDILAKYANKLFSQNRSAESRINASFLGEHGFI